MLIVDIADDLGIPCSKGTEVGAILEMMENYGYPFTVFSSGQISEDDDFVEGTSDILEQLDSYIETCLLPRMREELQEVLAATNSGLLRTQITQSMIPAIRRQLESDISAPIRERLSRELPDIERRIRLEETQSIRYKIRREVFDEVKCEVRKELLSKLEEL